LLDSLLQETRNIQNVATKPPHRQPNSTRFTGFCPAGGVSPPHRNKPLILTATQTTFYQTTS